MACITRSCTAALAGLVVALGLPATRAVGASADFNGDGFQDLAIGNPLMPGVGSDMVGEVTVLMGNASGLLALPAQVANGRQFRPGDPGLVAPSSLQFGIALATGDFNADGFADLAIGVPGATVTKIPPDCFPLQNCGTFQSAGAVQLIFGSPTGLDATQTGNLAPRLIPNPSPNASGESFGRALASGDFNGDSITDLAVGSPFRDTVDPFTGTVIANTGSVWMLAGNTTTGLAATGALSFSQLALQDDPELNDLFGSVLASGDFNADGRDDLAVGVPGEDLPGASTSSPQSATRTDAGAVAVIMGSSTGLTVTGNRFWHQNSSGLNGLQPPGTNVESGDGFGAAIVAGDFNGDGFADLAIGAPGEDLNPANDLASPSSRNGQVHVLLGSATGTTATGSRVLTQSTSAGTPEALDEFGSALAAGDFNADGRSDLVVGAPGERPDAGNVLNVGPDDAGELLVLFGGPTGPGSGSVPLFRLNGVQADQELGRVVEALDLGPASTPDDLVVGDSLFDLTTTPGLVDAGRIQVLLGQGDSSPLGPAGGGTQIITRDTSGVPGVATFDGRFGRALAR